MVATCLDVCIIYHISCDCMMNSSHYTTIYCPWGNHTNHYTTIYCPWDCGVMVSVVVSREVDCGVSVVVSRTVDCGVMVSVVKEFRPLFHIVICISCILFQNQKKNNFVSLNTTKWTFNTRGAQLWNNGGIANFSILSQWYSHISIEFKNVWHDCDDFCFPIVNFPILESNIHIHLLEYIS
jgi:hypothetical protein